jgi:hypothetical protein
VVSAFTSERTTDEATGKTKLVVRLEGRECLQEKLTGPIAKSYVGFVSIRQDLEDAAEMLRAAYALLEPSQNDRRNADGGDRYTALPSKTRLTIKAQFFASVCLYGRCFVSSLRRGTVLNEKSHVADHLRPKHTAIMSFRHGLVAHAGDVFDDGEAVVSYLIDDPRYRVSANLWRLDFMDDRDEDIGFLQLVEHVLEQANTKQQSLSQRLVDGQALAVVNKLQKRSKGQRAGSE